MQTLNLMTLLSVFQEMLGIWLWVMLALVVAGTASFLALLGYEKKVLTRRLVICQFLGVLGGGLALVLMAAVSSSGFTDAGGPVDWLLVGLVFGLGFLGTTVIFYALMGWSAALGCQRCARISGVA